MCRTPIRTSVTALTAQASWAASGQQSGGLYAGVAPGAKLIGTGSGAGLFILNALGGYEWSLANQFVYNIRVISNSWGSSGAFNPDNPINLATKEAHGRNIISVFAAGNDGPRTRHAQPIRKSAVGDLSRRGHKRRRARRLLVARNFQSSTPG